ncbi:MAG TPA: aminotransferase class V-fold PLP-dependent enzyme [Streptosporangiaceae bacterium]|nr:aminotransferase class V-fold PLP-dependent enzyme [Streptosporangiaceae bacterium]
MLISDAVGLWDPEPGWLNTASYGLPPRPTIDAMHAALEEWRRGSGPWTTWDLSTGRARAAFARLVGVPVDDVAVGASVSAMLSVVAAALPAGARVIVPEIEFTSNLFPWLVHADRGVRIDTVPVGKLAETIDARTDLVSFSVVQSATGEIAAVDDIIAAARRHGALVVGDASQAAGWLPVEAAGFDVLVCAGYKWLMTPRGTAFGYFSPAVRDRFRPLQANWYAGEDVADSYYGPSMRLAASARRFDLSPAWFSYVGAAPSMELLAEIGVEAVRAHDVALANRFRTGLGLPPGDSAIVSVDLPDAADRLAAAGVRAAVRHGRLRASFHLYTTEADVDRALNALDAFDAPG